MEKKTLEMSLLFDFFGDLLTEKQREYFDLYYNDDLSLAEIAADAGISRQGVRDIIVRAENQLTELEEKTGIVKRFASYNRDIDKALGLTEKITEASDPAEVKRLAKELNETVEKLRW